MIAKEVLTKQMEGCLVTMIKMGGGCCWYNVRCFLNKENQLTRFSHFDVPSIAMGLHCH
jgi:hypothetical protein